MPVWVTRRQNHSQFSLWLGWLAGMWHSAKKLHIQNSEEATLSLCCSDLSLTFEVVHVELILKMRAKTLHFHLLIDVR
jgi:hypothetical protein